jgi:AcrR family transcriptional regulator
MKHFSEMSESALRVVDAAEGLIQQRGYNGFSYDDVAKLVGIKKPSIHHHFATKGDLAATVAQRYTHRFREQLLRIEVQHAKAADRLTAYAALFVLLAVVTRHAVVIGLLYALIWESLIGSFVPGAQALSIQQWSLAITQKVLGARAEPLNINAAVGVGVAIPLLLVLIVGSTWYAGWRLRSLRLTSDD